MRRHQFPSFSEEYRKRWTDAGLWNDETLHHLFDQTVERKPDEVALTSLERRLTFREFKEESDALAAGLVRIGVGRGDIVAVQLPNWIEFCLLQIALSRIGAVIQPTHCVFRERELDSLFSFCETDVAVIPDVFDGHDYLEAMRSVRPGLESLRQVVVARPSRQMMENETSFESLVDNGREHPEMLDDLVTDPDDVFYLNFTSGTEGNPKGFLHSHNTLISTFKTLSTLMASMAPETVNLACSPMTHSFGHFTTYQCALAGLPMVIVDKYRPTPVLELIEREGVTSISGTPAHIIPLLHHPEFGKYDTSSVKAVSVGGARSAPELIQELEKVWGVKSANTYGMGETIIHTRTMPWDNEDKLANTVGQPVFGSELRITDPDDPSREVEVGEVGDIWFRGPTLFVGYHNQPELTAETRDEDGWFRTGDRGSLDDEGYLVFAGRASELINRGGTKLYPKSMEDLLAEHPSIEEVAVVGIPDDRLGEKVCAYIVTTGEEQISVSDLRTWVEAVGATKYLAPDEVVVVDELPMTPTGKVAKAALSKQAAERFSA